MEPRFVLLTFFRVKFFSFKCYLDMLDKLHKCVLRAVGSARAASLESLAHCLYAPCLY